MQSSTVKKLNHSSPILKKKRAIRNFPSDLYEPENTFNSEVNFFSIYNLYFSFSVKIYAMDLNASVTKVFL